MLLLPLVLQLEMHCTLQLCHILVFMQVVGGTWFALNLFACTKARKLVPHLHGSGEYLQLCGCLLWRLPSSHAVLQGRRPHGPH